MSAEKPQTTVRAVDRALTLLFTIARASEAQTLAEICAECGVDKATALRLLSTLEQYRLVHRDAHTRKYAIGSGAWLLASSYQTDLKEVAEPHLRRLRDQTGESVSLVVPRGLERVVLTVMEASHELRVVPSLNRVVPIYSGASGKILMAFLDPDERDRVIEMTGLKPVNEHSVTDRASFLKALDEVRREGYAVSHSDVTLGAAAVATPVFGADGKVGAALSLRGPEARLTAERIALLIPLVIEAARGISLAWSGRAAPKLAAEG